MDTRAKIHSIVKHFSNAMLITTGTGNRADARPMQMAKVEEDGDVWFFTRKSGQVVKEIDAEPVVLLVFQDESSVYLSLRGRARVVKDQERVKELWKEAYRVWFPGGMHDPELALLAVDPISAEYWDHRGMNKLDYMFEAAKAYVQGETPEVSDADPQHAKVNV